MIIENGHVNITRYWDVHYEIDYNHTSTYFHDQLRYLIDDSIKMHLRADVPIGSYLSGGMIQALSAC